MRAIYLYFLKCVFRLNKKINIHQIKEKAVIKWSDWFLALSCAIMSAKQLKLDLNRWFSTENFALRRRSASNEMCVTWKDD